MHAGRLAITLVCGLGLAIAGVGKPAAAQRGATPPQAPRLADRELTDDVRMAHRGLPRLASPAMSQRILTRLQKLSAPLGTTIAIENSIGVIRVRAATPASVGRQRAASGEDQ